MAARLVWDQVLRRFDSCHPDRAMATGSDWAIGLACSCELIAQTRCPGEGRDATPMAIVVRSSTVEQRLLMP